MKYFLVLLISLLPLTGLACQFNEQQLIGAYTLHAGNSQLQVFELNADKSFNSWLHERPDAQGFWSFNKCTINIHIKTDSTPIQMRLVTANKDKLVVKFKDETKQAVFKKIE